MKKNVNKSYNNNKLRRKLKKIITRKKYGDWAIILEDVFQRRAYEFELTDEEIIAEARNFVQNVNEICWVSENELDSSSTVGIYFSGDNGRICLNQDYFLNEYRYAQSNIDFGQMLYEVLTHEIYHAISDWYKLDDTMGLVFYDMIKGYYRGIAINEVFTEVAADRTSYSKNVADAEKGRRDTVGYPTITFSINLLAAALGWSEKELLKAGIQGREELSKFLNSKFSEKIFADVVGKGYLASFENALDAIYDVEYNSDEYVDSNEGFEASKKRVKEALKGLYKTAYEIMNFRIEVSNDDIDLNHVEELKYSLSKMERIVRDSFRNFNKSYNYSRKEQYEIMNSLNYIKSRVESQINGMNIIAKSCEVIDDQDLVKQVTNEGRGLISVCVSLRIKNKR